MSVYIYLIACPDRFTESAREILETVAIVPGLIVYCIIRIA